MIAIRRRTRTVYCNFNISTPELVRGRALNRSVNYARIESRPAALARYPAEPTAHPSVADDARRADSDGRVVAAARRRCANGRNEV
jgi:hypothetical protein